MENFVTRYSPTQADKKKFLTKTYGWMAFALLVSAVCAIYVASAPGLAMNLYRGGTFMIIAIAEIALVFFLSMGIRKISPFTAFLMFTAYAALNGVTLSTIFFIYSLDSIGQCFFSTALLFSFMAIYGSRTKSDLTKAGHYLQMAVFGIIIASMVNWLWAMITRTPMIMLNWLISMATVVVFTGLTAYDSQKILMAARRADSSDAYRKLAIVGALELYLDFINIFLSLLRLFGRSRD